MDQHQLIGLGGPANDFAMNGLAMHFASILIAGGHTLPLCLFMDVLLNKAKKLWEYIRTGHIGICLTMNIRAQSAIFQVYDTFTATMNLLLRFTLTNTLDLENHLFELYTAMQTLVESFFPEDEDDDMPPLEDIPNEF